MTDTPVLSNGLPPRNRFSVKNIKWHDEIALSAKHFSRETNDELQTDRKQFFSSESVVYLIYRKYIFLSEAILENASFGSGSLVRTAHASFM